MFGKLFRRDDEGSGPFYRPYRKKAANHIYNLLFCDNPALFKSDDGGGGALSAVLSDSTDREALETIGNDIDAESRVRALAFNRLRLMQVPVPPKRLLGTIIEFPQRDGLDTLAIFPDGRLRYINQSEGMAIFEASPPALIYKAEEVLRASQIAVNHNEPSGEPRQPPPTGELVRLSLLASDGLYLCEDEFDDLGTDRFAAPIMAAASDLLPLLVKEALRKNRGT